MKGALTSVEDLTQNLSDVENLYGEQDLSSSTLFAGGFINFGYWENINLNRKLSKKSRILSSQRLYEKVFESMDVNRDDAILEIGCGLGNGTVFLHKTFKPKYIIGIDAAEEQIQRALKRHHKYLKNHKDSIRFLADAAESVQIKPMSVSKVFSLEAIQHFSNVNCFLRSSFFALRPRGKLVIATFFFKSRPPMDFMERFPNFEKGIDKIIKVTEFTSKLQEQGFEEIRCQSIGENVWYGFDKWISQTEYKDTWDKNWIWAYKEGILDYFVFEAIKPSEK